MTCAIKVCAIKVCAIKVCAIKACAIKAGVVEIDSGSCCHGGYGFLKQVKGASTFAGGPDSVHGRVTGGAVTSGFWDRRYITGMSGLDSLRT
jgi:hypothetical protein